MDLTSVTNEALIAELRSRTDVLVMAGVLKREHHPSGKPGMFTSMSAQPHHELVLVGLTGVINFTALHAFDDKARAARGEA